MYSIKTFAVIAVGLTGLVATGRALQQERTQQQQTSAPPASRGSQIHGTPGSPTATEPIDGRFLPAPPAKFRGEVTLNPPQSRPYCPPRVAALEYAPHIQPLDAYDAGFGAPRTR